MSLTPDTDVQLLLDVPEPIEVVSCRIREGMSELTHAELEIASATHLELEGVLEAPSVIVMTLHGLPERRWTLRVGHIDFLRIQDASLRYRVNLYPAFWLLRFTTNTRKFRNMSAEQIVGQILDEHHVTHRFELERSTETRKYCAQYRETNLDFILRLLEFEGIHYTFDDDGTLVMADRSMDGAPVAGPSSYDLIEAAGALQWQEVGIHAFRKERNVSSGAATVNDYNWKKPKVSLISTSQADEDAELEIYDYPTGYRKPDQGTRLSQTRLEALRVPAHNVTGEGNVTGFGPGRAFTFGSLAGARFAGEYVLLKVDHQYHNRRFEEPALLVDGVAQDDDVVNYKNAFRGIPRATPFRAPLVTKHPHITGCHTAMVRGPQGEEIHTDQYGRFRVQFHWDREAKGTDEDSRWLRVLQETQTGLAIARVGWEYSVAYIDGDPDRPIGYARDINGAMPPEYGQPANKTRMTIKTPTYPNDGTFNELRLEDMAGSQHFDWTAERDLFSEIGNDRAEHVGNDDFSTTGASRTHTVKNDQTVSIGSNYELSIGFDDSNVVKKDRTESVGGDEKVTVTEVFTENTVKNETEKVGGDRIGEAGEERGGHARSITEDMTRKVGGSSTSKGKGDISLLVQKQLIEKVAGSKITRVADGGLTSIVSGKLELEVGSHSVWISEGPMGWGAENTKFAVTGPTTFQSGEQISINGSHIVLEATGNLTLDSAGLQIAMTPSSVAFKGPVRLKSGSVIKVAGNPDNLTK